MPQIIVKDSTPAPSPAAAPMQDAKSRAIAQLQASMEKNAQRTANPDGPPINQSNVALEDYAAAQPAKPTKTTETQESSQNTTTETPVSETVATAPPEASEPAKAPPALSAQYAQLAKQEKALRAAAQKLKADQAAFKAAQDAAKAPPPQVYDPTRHVDRESLKSDPFKVLADLGLTYEQLTQQALNAPTPEQVQYQNTVNELRSQINELKQAQEKANKAVEETQTQSYQQALNQIRSDARRLVNSDPAFETIKTTDSVNDVVQLIEKTFKEDKDEYGNPVLLTVEEAAKLVEDEISERLYTYASKVDKIKKRFAPTPAPAATKSEQQPQTETKQPQRPTLTNAIGSTGKLTAKERAIAAAKHGANWREKLGA